MYELFEEKLNENNTTAYAVSQATGIAQSTLSDWKAGKYTPKADKLMLLAEYFGLPSDYFLKK